MKNRPLAHFGYHCNHQLWASFALAAGILSAVSLTPALAANSTPAHSGTSTAAQATNSAPNKGGDSKTAGSPKSAAADAKGASNQPSGASPEKNANIMFLLQPEPSMANGGAETAVVGKERTKPSGDATAAGATNKVNSGSTCPPKHKGGRSLAPCTAWVDADVEPKAALLCVHGLGLHNATYQSFGERMSKAGIATYAVDVRGFGSWQQANGRTDVDFEDCLTDVADTLRFIHKANPGLPVFILGESMGGAIALRITSKYPELVDGLISCVPSGDRFKQRAGELKVALHFLQGANKKFDVGTNVIEQASSSSDSTNVNEGLKSAWANDPLAKLKLSPKELIQFQKFMNENHEAAKLICSRPVLMVQGWEDNLVKWTGTLELWKELPTDDKQIELIPNAKHLIFEESQFNDQALNERVDKMVTRWIDDHIKKPNTVREASNSSKP